MADEEAKSEEEAKPEGKRTGKTNQTPAAAESDGCSVAKCKQPVRAKGLCRKHYIAWRREAVGEHHRYKVCSKEGCRKKRVAGGLCEEHAGSGGGGAAKAEGGAAPAA
jgi:hypothetical protein